MARTKESRKRIDVRDPSILLGSRRNKLRSDHEIDPVKALKMRRGGFTYEEIAEMLTPPDRIQPFTKQSVMYAIGKIVQDDEKDVLSRGYTKTEQQELVASLLKEKHIAALRAITEEKLEAESAKDNAATAKTLFDQLRLETGKSTSNISSFSKIIESSMDEDGF